MKKLYLTKKREQDLHIALSIDDVLYRKFEVMNERLNAQQRQWNRGKQVIKVLQRKQEGIYILPILKEIKTAEGIILEVG